MTQVGESIAVPAVATEKSEPKIILVRWLDGADTKLISSGKQWVNLPTDAKWVDSTVIKNKDRLGYKPRIFVKFSEKGAHSFTLKLVPDTGNDVYTGAEKGRNSKFKYQTAEKSYTTGGDGTKIIDGDMFLTIAGNHEFSILAKDKKGNEVTTGDLKLWRKVYFYEAKMTGTSSASQVNTMKGEFKKHNIDMTPAGSDSVARLENIGTASDTATYKARVKTAFNANATAKAKVPYVIIVGYTDHLAVKDANQTVTKAAVQVGPGKSKVSIPIVNAAGSNKYLWQDIVTGEDWFVSCKFKKDGETTETSIPEAKLTAVALRTSMSREVEIDVTGLALGTGTITLKVNWVNRMRGGLSFPGTNLVCICTKAWWSAKSSASQNQVMIHEIGHQMNMVADGTGKGPDKVATHYVGKGHRGDHCYKGCGVLASYSSASSSSTCVMFGATNGKTAFCSNCAPAVKKQDLTAGFGAL